MYFLTLFCYFIRIFNENLTAVHSLRTLLKLNKPIYVGMSILDLSKTLMYDFHYAYMQPKYEAGLKLLFTDTDSLCYHVHTDDMYKVSFFVCIQNVARLIF